MGFCYVPQADCELTALLLPQPSQELGSEVSGISTHGILDGVFLIATEETEKPGDEEECGFWS